MKVDHIGIAVKSIGSIRDFIRKVFEKEISEIEEVPAQKVRVGFIDVNGVRIEFIEATDVSSPVAKFIEKKGEGIHHIALNVENLNAILERLKREGVKLVDEVPRDGAHGKKVAFLYPVNGVLIELVEG